MSKLSKDYRKAAHDEIAACAQRIYETEGRPQGRAMEHWLRAEAQLSAERKDDSRSSVMKVANRSPASPSRGRSAQATSNSQTASRNSLQKH
jgi:hypothetical protein